MSTVYVVTSGEYDDYGILGVFLDRNQAVDFSERLNSQGGYNGDLAEVEEYAVGRFNDFINSPAWGASVDLETDELVELPRVSIGRKRAVSGKRADRDYLNKNGKAAYYSFVSQEHASQCAVEYRTAVLQQRAFWKGYR